MTHVKRITSIVKLNLKSSMLKSSLCDCNYACILVKRTISITPAPTPEANLNNNDKEVVLKICNSCDDYISEINNTQLDNAKTLMQLCQFKIQ